MVKYIKLRNSKHTYFFLMLVHGNILYSLRTEIRFIECIIPWRNDFDFVSTFSEEILYRPIVLHHSRLYSVETILNWKTITLSSSGFIRLYLLLLVILYLFDIICKYAVNIKNKTLNSKSIISVTNFFLPNVYFMCLIFLDFLFTYIGMYIFNYSITHDDSPRPRIGGFKKVYTLYSRL